MFGDDKNLKDPEGKSLTSYGAGRQNMSLMESYPKLNKLITALYIVTDIMDKEEPIRLKLRTLGVEILSDTGFSSRTEISKKTTAILSLLDIASTINLISEMNFNILKKEFIEFGASLGVPKESKEVDHVWLEEFLQNSPQTLPHPRLSTPPDLPLSRETNDFPLTRGNTRGLKERGNASTRKRDINTAFALKKQRRDEIIEAIKASGGKATITEVKMKGSGSLSTCGGKTLQRELISMVQEGILGKTGEKRWSRYSLL